ncbi:initiator tRNA phosphoribosyl transferase [Cladophialophora yegresii CBS 114405]|uniref:Initiator tRNA phosphoribosyl transferase n=1 Tax=Cladophialophora yegresii CBS 114405 TaxID=1182544 RepID=W9W4A1_9EURO|nr:initiator tRNA phosphoribosyl transferase [Cladophialophora yegresii CBS 114405]EXJ62892.1 initiator tRNA phosphoribosyl transferase [Cladophialophora yegresii CBS 114405]
MTPLEFPTRLADLSLNDSSHNPSLYANLKSIRKSTLSVSNRLNSIVKDAEFVKEVSCHLGLPLVANERCGSWYIDPADKAGSAYFKSTDGHHGQWDFSPRRLNLQLFPILSAHGGAILVDSTRRGKNLPDAFSKTVPIWVAVVNRALFPEATSMHRFQSPPPPDNIQPSELSQIAARLDGFTKTFCHLGLDLQRLRSQLGGPIRVSWAINRQSDNGYDLGDESGVTSSSRDLHPSCHHLVLCSASRRVRGAEISEGGYIQGAGDDSEGWSHNLTAQLFWQHKDLLMRSPEDELPALIKTLLEQDGNSRLSSMAATRIIPTTTMFIASGPLDGFGSFDLIVNCQGDSQNSTSKAVYLKCRPGKSGSKDLRDQVSVAVNAIRDKLLRQSESQILVTCSTGKDLSVGVAAAALCLLYDNEGQLRAANEHPLVDKHLVKQRLAWITSSKADANPSRATLQAVHSFLMRRPE